MEVDYFEGKISKCCYNSGTWQTRFISLIIQGDLFTLHTGKVFVEETTTIEALSFNNCGLWKIKEAIKIILKGSANFYASSKFNANLLKIIAEGQCTIAGYLSLENLLAYIRNDMITVPGARVNITIGATIAVGTFRNDCSWYVDGNLHLHVACFEQSEDGLIFVKDTFTMIIYDISEERCNGRIVANYFIMNLAKRVRFDSYIRVNQIEICIPYVNESSTFSCYSILNIFYSLLSGMDSIATDATYRTLISCNSLHTQRTSLIDSIPKCLFPEGILCATTWLHEGQIRFNGEKVYIITDGLINRGRLTSGNKLQNHMREVIVLAENYFRNDAVFSADRIIIHGNGKLQNTNRIFANNEMNIQLANFCSEFGQTHLEGTQPKLLSAKNEYNRIEEGGEGGRGGGGGGNHINECNRRIGEGYNEAHGNFNISSSSLSSSKGNVDCMIVNRYKSKRQIRLSARSRLHIDNDIINNHNKIILIARDAIICKSHINADILELTLGAAYMTEFVIKNNATIIANQLQIMGSCKYLTVIIDGELSCETLIIDARIRQIKIIGNGILCCRKSCNIGGDMITLAIRDIRITELIGSMITIASDSALNISSFDSQLKMLSIYADNCYLQGRIFVEHKIILKITNGICHISGEILGIGINSEISLECNELILTGIVANLNFLECYTRRKIEQHETGIMKNVKNIVLEAEFITLNGKIMDSESVIATGDDVNIDGILQNQNDKNITYSIFGQKILFDGEIFGPIRLELSGTEIIFTGITNNLKFLDIDANLATIAPKGLKCENFNIIAYSAILDGNFNIGIFAATIQVALFIRTNLTDCGQCKLIAPIILALNYPMSSKMDISAIIYAFERFELLESGKHHELSDLKNQFTPITSNCSINNDAKILHSQQSSIDNNINIRNEIFIKISFHSHIITNHYTTLKEYDLLRKTTKIIDECFKKITNNI
ncbi:hypothetical protein LOAG_12511 [Loa loa]|uniref:Uncharacterized protein n=1 Tax=Loa loa TaxID=7209 RepID=A0A1S0TL65_LOALO|nr:hypothetical protein LOAG_12511 [Loa loa]EFO15998.1 hypothetical protein LOAG_12511 [Loa loa]